jgi:hypothetical protein
MTELPQGQLSSIEREYLFDIVVNLKPNIVLESGTWYGGGSTMSLAKGLFENQKGILHTYEEHTPFYSVANNFYKSSKYNMFVQLHNGTFIDGVNSFTPEDFDSVDIIFLDGGDEAPNGHTKYDIKVYYNDPTKSENVQSFVLLDSLVKPNTHILHDWSVYGGRGSFVQEYFHRNPYIANKYRFVSVVGGSTGLAHLVRV